MKHYARLWNCGYKTTRANTGHNQVIVYSFDSKSARDAACAEYRAPNHCPTATLEAVAASDEDVRREKRSECGIPEWADR